MRVEAELEKEKDEPREQLDLAFKEGETIKVNNQNNWLSGLQCEISRKMKKCIISQTNLEIFLTPPSVAQK